MINGIADSSFKCPSCKCEFELTCEPQEIPNGEYSEKTGNKLSVEAREHLRKHLVKDSTEIIHGVRRAMEGYSITKRDMLQNAIKIIEDEARTTIPATTCALRGGDGAAVYYEALTVIRIGKVVLNDLASEGSSVSG